VANSNAACHVQDHPSIYHPPQQLVESAPVQSAFSLFHCQPSPSPADSPLLAWVSCARSQEQQGQTGFVGEGFFIPHVFLGDGRRLLQHRCPCLHPIRYTFNQAKCTSESHTRPRSMEAFSSRLVGHLLSYWTASADLLAHHPHTKKVSRQ